MKKLRIAQIAPPWFPVPPVGYGGIELVVSYVADGLVDRGHDVTMFASGDSKTKARLESFWEEAIPYQITQVYPDLIHVLQAYYRADEFDIIHDHSGMIGPAIGSFVDTPVLFTLHGVAADHLKTLHHTISPRIYYNSISDEQARQYGDLNFIGTVYNGIDPSLYPLVGWEDKENYLLFLGRVSQLKGTHLAVKVARELGLPIKLVTKIHTEDEKEYFKEYVEPLMDDSVELIGEVDIETKAALYGRARATMFPIQWAEPFGLVMIESMATGTPVVAIRDGSVPEVMVDGVTGFIVENSLDELIAATKRVEEIDPVACRRHVEEHFTVEKQVDAYEEAYFEILRREGRLG